MSHLNNNLDFSFGLLKEEIIKMYDELGTNSKKIDLLLSEIDMALFDLDNLSIRIKKLQESLKDDIAD